MKNTQLFRLLEADEIEVRVATVRENGCSCLLYKTARTDVTLLDEAVGPMNWQCKYTRDNRNCSISIYDADKGEWITKEDTGTESNTEEIKGLASDSFKRAGFKWGLGIELYSAPFIWIPANKTTITNKNGKPACYEKFAVSAIAYNDKRKISGLTITDSKGNTVFSYGKPTTQPVNKPTDAPADEPCMCSAASKEAIQNMAKQAGIPLDFITKNYGIKTLDEMTDKQALALIKKFHICVASYAREIDPDELPYN